MVDLYVISVLGCTLHVVSIETIMGLFAESHVFSRGPVFVERLVSLLNRCN